MPQQPSLPEAPHVERPNHVPAQNPDSQSLYEYFTGIAVVANSGSKFLCTRDGFYFGPHPSDCQKYFICANRKIHLHQCGFGIHWNYAHSQCDLSDRAMCYARSQQSTSGNDGFNGNVPANHEISNNDLEEQDVDETEDNTWGFIGQEITKQPEDANDSSPWIVLPTGAAEQQEIIPTAEGTAENNGDLAVPPPPPGTIESHENSEGILVEVDDEATLAPSM